MPEYKSGRTRVNLRRNLENLRDSYGEMESLEEIILVELIANSVDAEAYEIDIEISNGVFSIKDDGRGMPGEGFREYHDLSESSKERGKSIGFAGEGSKLALLMARLVITETKQTESEDLHLISFWRLDGDYEAPYIFRDPRKKEGGPRDEKWASLLRVASAAGVKLPTLDDTGTKVAIFPMEKSSPLLNPDWVKRVIQKHYFPLLDGNFADFYGLKRGEGTIGFSVNAQAVEIETISPDMVWRVSDSRTRYFGYLVRFEDQGDIPLHMQDPGIYIAVYGKIITKGWDLLSVYPANRELLRGVLEFTELSRDLMSNKLGFEKRAPHGKHLRDCLKTLSKKVMEVLEKKGEMGEKPEPETPREIIDEASRIIKDMMKEVPQMSDLLEGLINIRKASLFSRESIIPHPEGPEKADRAPGQEPVVGDGAGTGGQGTGLSQGEGPLPGDGYKEHPEGREPARREKRRIRGSLNYGETDFTTQFPEESALISKITSDTIFTNNTHPAFLRASGYGERAMRLFRMMAVAFAVANMAGVSGYSWNDVFGKFFEIFGRMGKR